MASFWEMLRVPTDDGDLLDDMATYVSQPNVAGKHPAVIVIQEIFGVNSNIQTICDRFRRGGLLRSGPGPVPPRGHLRGGQRNQPCVWVRRGP